MNSKVNRQCRSDFHNIIVILDLTGEIRHRDLSNSINTCSRRYMYGRSLKIARYREFEGQP